MAGWNLDDDSLMRVRCRNEKANDFLPAMCGDALLCMIIFDHVINNVLMLIHVTQVLQITVIPVFHTILQDILCNLWIEELFSLSCHLLENILEATHGLHCYLLMVVDVLDQILVSGDVF